MKKIFGKFGKKGSSSKPTPPPSPNLGAVGGSISVNSGYEVKEKDLPKLHKAVWSEDLMKVKSLVKKDVNALDKENRTALHLACVKGNKKIVQELLEWHAKPNIGDNDGKTPLLKAVECGRVDCVMLLLQHNADVDTRDRDGDTAVHVAVQKSSTEILKLLIKCGADINIKNKESFAPLHLAVKNKKDEVTKILLQNHADFDVMDADGRTPLMFACYEGAITQVKDLISVGADIKIKDSKGFTAEDIANQKGQHACSHLLMEHNNRQSAASTPRLPSGSSTPRVPSLSTPRQPSSDLQYGLPATQAAHDDDSDEDGTFSNNHGDDSWKSEADMSLSIHGKDDTDDEVTSDQPSGPKVNLARALEGLDQDRHDNQENEGEDHVIQAKRLSNKSLQSVTSAEIGWSEDDDDDKSPMNTPPRKASASKVSFIDKDVSDIHEITATESETDDGGEYQGSEAKRPKYDHTFHHQQDSGGYTPTGVTSPGNDAVNQEKLRGRNQVEHDYVNGEFMKDIGLDDDDFTSTPDISEMSEAIDLPSDNQPPPVKQDTEVTPRSQKSILKNSPKQHNPEPNTLIQPSQGHRSDEETSEWDSDVEQMLDPQKSSGSNWDSTTSAITPRDVPTQLTTAAVDIVIDDEELDNEMKEESPRPASPDYISPGDEISPRQSSPDHISPDEISPRVGEPVELMQTGGSHASYVTTSTESQQSKVTVIQKTDVVHNQYEPEDDSEWDSEEDESIPCIENVSPPIGVSPIVRGSVDEEKDESISESEDKESISEWEIENRNAKIRKQQEEEEREREEQLERQKEAERLKKEEEFEEIRRLEQLKRREEEEFLNQQQEEDEDSVEERQSESEDESKTKRGSYTEDKTSPRRCEMRRVNLLSVTDFLKSSKSEIYKDGVSPNRGQQKVVTTSKQEDDDDDDDYRETPPDVPPPQVPVETPIHTSDDEVTEEPIQKEIKQEVKSEVAATVFTSNQTNTKIDVEKSKDPSKKEGKLRPMSVESVDITADDDDESVDLDHLADPERSDMGTYLKNLPTSYSAYKYSGPLFDDDLISLTSTEVDDSVNYQSNAPYGKDILANMNLSDPGTVLKLQDYMHEQNKRLDQERNSRLTTENKYKSLVKEKNNLERKVDQLTQQRSSLEQEKLELETRIRNLEYKMNEESEMRKNAETLLSKTKEQLNKKEEQYTIEIEAKQAAELQMRNLHMEIRSANNTIKQLEEEKEEFQHQLQHEKNARQMQEQINEEQSRLHQQLQFKQAEITAQQTEAVNQLEEVDEDRKQAHDSLSIQRAELTALKSELEKERKRRRDEISMMSAENEELQARIEELKSENKMTEDALTKASMTHSLQVSNLNTEITLLTSQYEKERASKEKVDAELESLKTRLQSSSWEVDKAEQARSEVERRLQYEKEEWTKKLENSQKDNSLLKDQQQTLLHRLSNIEAKLNAVENELHVSNTSLLERTNQLQQCQKDLQFYKSAQDSYDQNYKLEKEHNAKLQSKVDGLQERVTGFQHENLTLRQSMEALQHTISDKSGQDSHEKFTSMLASLKTENEKARLNLEERNSTLSEQVSRLKDENRNLESRRNNLEQENQKLNREYTELFKKLSVAEASYQVTSKAKEDSDSERNKLSMDLERSQAKYETSQQKCFELQTRVAELVERAEKAENLSAQTKVQLQNTSINEGEQTKIRHGLEDTLHHLQIDNTRLDAELKHERQRVEQLQKDLQDSQKVRDSLEALCSNLKSANNLLEEKREHDPSDNSMEEEVSTRALLTQEAEENKELWEKEVVSRSKLGLRISQYEKQRQEVLSQLEEERKKARKASEKLRIAETKLESEQEKNVELQKELASLKGYLKMAKKKLKVVENGDTRVNTLTSEFDKERLTMENTLSEARLQIDSLQRTLDDEVQEKEHLQANNVSLQTKIASLKLLEKNVDKLEKKKRNLEEEFNSYKAKIENGFINKDELNQKEKELEAHYRLQLNRKLDEINNYLEQQARAREKLDNSRDETEYKYKESKRKLEEENASLKISCEQVKAQRDSKEMEAKRFRDLYESEMQWRMRLSEQLIRTTDKAYGYKSNADRRRIHNNLSFSSPGNALDYSRLTMNGDDILSNRLKLELDRSIAKHLEAAPHDNIQPVMRTHDDSFMNNSYAKSSAEYLELLKRKYCV